jgi:arylformamidase
MLATISQQTQTFQVDFSKPLDISIPLRAGIENVNAFHAAPVIIEPFKMGDWVGEIKSGSPVNYRNVFFNPHGNGTHTECVGHISKEEFSINQCLKEFFFIAQLISVRPAKMNKDLIIKSGHIPSHIFQLPLKPQALIIRTLPNDESKLNHQYTGTNPCYLHHEAAEYVRTFGINHLLIDLPSVDREEDDGKLLAHKAFWEYPHNTQMHRTITELIFVPNEIPDGTYLLNLQMASFENDASPSKPVIYKIIHV